MTKLVKFVFGTDTVSGRSVENAYWIDPDRIVSVRAAVAGRHSSFIDIDGGPKLEVDMSPDRTVNIINETIAKAREPIRKAA